MDDVTNLIGQEEILMNQTRTQSMYTDDQPSLSAPVFSVEDKMKCSRRDDIYQQVQERFMQQTVCYLRGNLN